MSMEKACGHNRVVTFNALIDDDGKNPTFGAVWRYGRCLIPGGLY
jgi:hypothetical protein